MTRVPSRAFVTYISDFSLGETSIAIVAYINVISTLKIRVPKMADFMNNPYWNLDLAITTKTAAKAAESVATAAAEKAQEIPLSTIVYRTVEMASKPSQFKSSLDWNPLILRIRWEVHKFFCRMPRIDMAFITAPAKKFVWATSILITAYIAVEVSIAAYKSYAASRGNPRGPVIPIDPTVPIGLPHPPNPSEPPIKNPPPGPTPAPKPSARDVRVKLFTEILTGYLTLVLSVSFLLGDSVILKFLLSGLTGFVAMVSLMLPDEAEWSAELYNFKEGGFEMQDVAVERDLDERIKKLSMKEKAETKLKEVREKVVERIQEASDTTKKVKKQVKEQAKELLGPKKKEEDVAVRGQEEPGAEATEGELPGNPNDDLKTQLSKVMAPVRNVLDTDKTIERASRKVEEWLIRAGDSFGADGDEKTEEQTTVAESSAEPVASKRRSFQAEDGTLRLR
ncbi:hypothetical protein H072_3367 [Dactylellina haptotyla CBS 200.50]|uniref:Uncharacterized protein n=1 Tax=Dactylellina haptotyla (strain CBS 200.50) TaxID=1284197 RepID=S8AI87_DACHA|nr:hypothetical protein H072_3367 [Dactylellina haptotyla CBS 200.50]